MIKLTTLGSGTFFVNKDVSASAFLLQVDGKNILIDCGPGTLVKLSEAGFKLEDLDYVFITHL
ncbi:MBL fold metallo-hydrolase, partial [Candidatus Dojkabacteria bacterium]|nr:MBL fold metallo-hydrolase [Candidatus Dojkabacteria bacterium]